MKKLTGADKYKQLDEKIKQQKNEVIRDISDKGIMISAKVNRDRYTLFKKINKIKGVSNNSIINLLINNYIEQNSTYLDEED